MDGNLPGSLSCSLLFLETHGTGSPNPIPCNAEKLTILEAGRGGYYKEDGGLWTEGLEQVIHTSSE